MKRFIKITIISLLVLIVAVVAIPFLVPLDAYKNQIITMVKEKTGRDLIIDGHIKASVFPVLGVKIGKASLSNPKNFTDKDMLQVDSLAVEVGINALLHKQLQVKKFILVKPVINLEVKNSKPNWEFGVSGSSDNEKTTSKSQSDGGEASSLAGLMLGDIKITDGTINYRDGKSKSNIAITALNLKASLPSLEDKFSVDGDLVWNGEKVVISALVAKPNQIINGKNSAVIFDVKANPVTLHYSGEATAENVKGAVDLKIPSIPTLAKWTGSAFDWKNSAALAFSVRGDLNGSPVAIALKNAEIALDTTIFKGDIKAKLNEKIPAIEATLASDSLNLNPYIKQAAAQTSWVAQSAVAAEFSDKNIDLSGLSAVNAKISLTLGSILYEKIKLGKTVVNADLNNGILKLNIPDVALYGGSAKVSASLSSSGGFTKQLNITNVNVGELLGDITVNNRFIGTINASANLNGKLTSVQGALRSLGGNGSVKVVDGAIKGIDLKDMVNNIKSAFTNVDSSNAQTVFNDLSGTFTITQGIVTNNDLKLTSQLLTLSGKGAVNLPMQTIQYRLNPTIVSTVKRGDGSDTKGLEVPIIIEGSFDNLHFVPDLAGMVKNTLENPNALRNTVKSLQEQFKDGNGSVEGVKDLLKGFGQ